MIKELTIYYGPEHYHNKTFEISNRTLGKWDVEKILEHGDELFSIKYYGIKSIDYINKRMLIYWSITND